MDANDKKYSYERFGSKGKRVGQASLDILSKDQPVYTAGEVLDAYAPDFLKHLEQAIENGAKQHEGTFCVFVLTKKEHWTTNVVRNWFIARKTVPGALDAMHQYPNHTKTAYLVDAKKGMIELLWSLPGYAECTAILRSEGTFDPLLVKWILDCFQGKLENCEYSFEAIKAAKKYLIAA